MGNNSQSQAKNSDIFNQYTFLRSVTDGKNLYRNNKTLKQFITVQRTFANPQMLLQYEKNMRKLLQINHPYFLNQKEHAMVTFSTICSIHHRVVHFFQYQPHTLQQQLQTRKKHQRYFQQKEVWSILCSSVLAMAHLTKNEVLCYNLHPKDMVIDKVGMIKIVSPLLSDNNNQEILDSTFYYSPQHLKGLKNTNFSQLSNKSSIFTLGITLLHILSLQPMNELYNYENCTINMQLLKQLVDKISQVQIRSIIKKMVKLHGYDRITFTELEQMLYNVLEGQNAIGRGQKQERRLPTQTYENNSQVQKLQESIFGVYKSRQQAQQKPTANLVYMKGSNMSRISNPDKISINRQQNYHCNTDTQDYCTPLCYQSVVDNEDIDEEDALGSNCQELTNYNKLAQSNLHKNIFPTNDSRRIVGQHENEMRSALLQKTHKYLSLENIMNKDQDQNGKFRICMSQTLEKQYQNKPYHVREQLSRGVYEGYKLNRMRHGYGVFDYAQGGKYVGQWVKNKMEGRGALYYTNQQIAYEGEWKNDKLHGFGILYNQIPSYHSQPIDFQSLHLVDNCWIKYEGNFFEDQKNGQGTLFLSNGQYYRGCFKDDLPSGNGLFKCLNGTVLKGNWVLGVLQ